MLPVVLLRQVVVAVAQLVEPRVVVAVVAGSNPVGHPKMGAPQGAPISRCSTGACVVVRVGNSSPVEAHARYHGVPLAPLAQLVEQQTLNLQVLGSSPRGRTNRFGLVRLGLDVCVEVERHLRGEAQQDGLGQQAQARQRRHSSRYLVRGCQNLGRGGATASVDEAQRVAVGQADRRPVVPTGEPGALHQPPCRNLVGVTVDLPRRQRCHLAVAPGCQARSSTPSG